MKVYVVQEHITEGVWCFGYYQTQDCCDVISESFVEFRDAYNYARQKAFEFAQNGWLVNYTETERSVYLDVDGMVTNESKYITHLWASYSVREVNINL